MAGGRPDIQSFCPRWDGRRVTPICVAESPLLPAPTSQILQLAASMGKNPKQRQSGAENHSRQCHQRMRLSIISFNTAPLLLLSGAVPVEALSTLPLWRRYRGQPSQHQCRRWSPQPSNFTPPLLETVEASKWRSLPTGAPQPLTIASELQRIPPFMICYNKLQDTVLPGYCPPPPVSTGTIWD